MTSEDRLIAGAIAETLRRSWTGAAPLLVLPPDLPVGRWCERLVAGGVAGLAWARVRGTQLRAWPELETLHAASGHHALTAARQERDLVHLIGHFNQAGLEPILFKGWTLARLYPHRGMRPFGDFDLLVREDQAERARGVLRSLGADLQSRADVDTVATLSRYLPDRSEGELFGRAQRESLDSARFLTLAAEDHLRLVSLHQLHHGAWRPLWLCDVAVLLESLPRDFRWERCLAGDARLSEGVLATVALARELLAARAPDDTPQVSVPAWLRRAVLHGWVNGYESMPPSLYELRRLGLGRALRAIGARWPDPVSATVHLRAPLRAVPRFLVQMAECIRRAADFVRRDIRWRLGLDAHLATVGKGVVP
ncbi:MAG TPA: nucleotidyltransferase family protein [Myxococcaceae bacterium]|nr:nucleotidyltransferase family protein [Myxococcaceae bacterium]